MDKNLWVDPCTLLLPQPDYQVPMTIVLLRLATLVPWEQRQVLYHFHRHFLPATNDDGEVLDGLFTEYLVNITTGN